MSLYNAKRVPDAYRVTKFTDDLDAESSYITTRDSCDCPAGHRDTCRHRQMLPDFIANERVNSEWFLDWDNRRWFYYNSENGRMTSQPPRASWRRF
jgi:hypothetical protein